MSTREIAELQVLLEGLPLPAAKNELLDYAARQDDPNGLTALLQRLPDREYASLDEVGEELVPVQPERPLPDRHEPRSESGLPPGGNAYTKPRPEPGAVREHGPHG
jgi:uncharacterized protein DUF2795